MAGEIISFGKYKGKPVEAMVQDRAYLDWLLTQAWFRERYVNLYTLIVNDFQQPADTPEHNALQAKFLNEDFRMRFLRVLGEEKGRRFEFEYYGFDVHLTVDTGVSYSIEIKPSVGDDYPAVLRQIKSATRQRTIEYQRSVPIEFGGLVLFLQDYTGQGASEAEFIKIFAASDIKVVFLHEVENSFDSFFARE